MAELRDQARRDAVHFKFLELPEPSAIVVAKPCYVVLCGHAASAPLFGAFPWTDDVDRVTCRQCVEALVARGMVPSG